MAATDRRATPRRRARDRIATGVPTAPTAATSEAADLHALLEDDLRQAALALGAVESYLVRATSLLERGEAARAELRALAGDAEVLERLDDLEENLGALRRRMAQAARG